MRRLIISLIALACVSASCDKLHEGRFFTPVNPTEERVLFYEYDFELERDYLYDTSILCRFSPKDIASDYLNLTIRLVSPSKEVYKEHLSLPLVTEKKVAKANEGINISKGWEKVDIEWKYRSNIRPSAESGIWTIRITPDSEEVLQGIWGIGFEYEGK